MRFRLHSAKLIVVINILLLFSVLGEASQGRLKCDGIQFPVAVDFPVSYSVQKFSANTSHPTMYLFSGEDIKETTVYAVSIADLEHVTSVLLSDDENQEFVDLILENQINVVDSQYGVTSQILFTNTKKISGKNARTIELLRDLAGVSVFSRYSTVVVSRYAVTLWSSGADSEETRLRVRAFGDSLQIKEH